MILAHFQHVELHPLLSIAHNSVMVACTMFKLTWWSSLVVPHIQVCQALCRSYGLAAILDFLKNNMACNLVMLPHSMLKLIWWSSLVVPHMQVCEALCRSRGLAAILDFLKNSTWPVTANVCLDHTLFMRSILVHIHHFELAHCFCCVVVSLWDSLLGVHVDTSVFRGT